MDNNYPELFEMRGTVWSILYIVVYPVQFFFARDNRSNLLKNSITQFFLNAHIFGAQLCDRCPDSNNMVC